MGLASPGRAILRRGRSKHQSRLLLAVVGCALLVAACGASSPSAIGAATGSSTIAVLDRYAACMRDHGVSGFPDPSTTESGSNGFGIDGYNFNLPGTMITQSPAYESADKTCESVVDIGPGSGGNGPNAAVLARARKAALAHAECMREHGVPTFPDPTISSKGGGVSASSDGRGINPRSPAFQQAQRVCGGG
jgi:hypothetical protein